MAGLCTILANCCESRNLRKLVIQYGGVEQLICQIKKSDLGSQICYVLCAVNRSA
jgi:hypothetical protein